MEEFVEERGWQRFHTPRNLVLAFTGEAGELAECFQWRGDEDCAVGLPSWKAEDKEALAHEMADCLLYLTRLATQCGVDLDAAVASKLAKVCCKLLAQFRG